MFYLLKGDYSLRHTPTKMCRALSLQGGGRMGTCLLGFVSLKGYRGMWDRILSEEVVVCKEWTIEHILKGRMHLTA